MTRLFLYAFHYLFSFLPLQKKHTGVGHPDREDRPLVILGNGPALKGYMESMSVPEEGVDYMCVNFFGSNGAFAFFQPRHYVVFDPVLFQGLDNNESVSTRLLLEINSKVKWEMTFYIPLRFVGQRRKIDELLSSPMIRVIYFRDAGFLIKGGVVSHWLMKRQIIMPKAQNVLVACVYLSVIMGYRSVFLEGADHSWHKYLAINDDNKLMIKDVHFYDGNPKQSPLYKDASNKIYFTMSEIFYAYYRVHQGYTALRGFADRCGVMIVNRTPGSFIDAFDRKVRDL